MTESTGQRTVPSYPQKKKLEAQMREEIAKGSVFADLQALANHLSMACGFPVSTGVVTGMFRDTDMERTDLCKRQSPGGSSREPIRALRKAVRQLDARLKRLERALLEPSDYEKDQPLFQDQEDPEE